MNFTNLTLVLLFIKMKLKDLSSVFPVYSTFKIIYVCVYIQNIQYYCFYSVYTVIF